MQERPRPRRPSVPRWVAPAAVLAVALAGSGCRREEPSLPAAPAEREAPVFVGSAACAGCHAGEARRWRGSHHDVALQRASEASVLGRFDGSQAAHRGVEATFSKRDGRFFVHTEGPDGSPGSFEVTETFGVDPLQQYLVPLSGGRKQALAWAWDARPETDGGQRWIHLQPGESAPPGDPMHWTGVAGSWNHQCAECHSTQVRKGYDAVSATYATTAAEEDVACEACHGPGSRHVAWAEAAGKGDGDAGDPLRGLVFRIGAVDGARWLRVPGERIARRSLPRASQTEIETCARCHSRRSTLREDPARGRPILDTHLVALLDEGLYFADGQIQDEVYEYGSFLQSRMYAAGVTCSDCHDPHALGLREAGNALCGRCHAPEVFDTAGHHHHAAGSSAARCISCHMPARTYMEVDVRHDHSLRVPRPEVSAAVGAPDVCTACHAERSPHWAAAAIASWRREAALPRAHFGVALYAGRSGAAGAEEQLAALALDGEAPAIARATALRLLGEFLTPRSLPALRAGAASTDPLLRVAAAGAAAALPPAERVSSIGTLLRDPVLAVRSEAALALAEIDPAHLDPQARMALAGALAEHRAILERGLDQPHSHVGLGNLHRMLGDLDAARAAFERAIGIAPWAIPAYVNLADLDRALGREAQAEATLRRALARDPENADVLHALGLALVRQRRMAEAVEVLGRAAVRAPDRSRYAVVHALALEAVGEADRAAALLDAARSRRPGDPAFDGLLPPDDAAR